MILLEEFIVEIENTFKNYSETGDIDRVSIKGWVIDCLREMGKDICEQRETIVLVENSQAKLPETFKSLILALNLNIDGITIRGNRQRAEDSFIYRQTIEQPAYFDFITNEYVSGCDTKIITERIIMNEQPVDFYYKPEFLSVVKGFKKDSFEVNCINLHPSLRDGHYHQINIHGKTMQTNFKSGKIYIQYNSLPTDEDGEVVIPEITTGDLRKYIENYVKIKIAEDLILNNKNPTGIKDLFSLWLQKEREYRNAAKSEVKFGNLDKNWSKRHRKRLQIETDKFNLPRY
jgi:hypothetical protein